MADRTRERPPPAAPPPGHALTGWEQRITRGANCGLLGACECGKILLGQSGNQDAARRVMLTACRQHAGRHRAAIARRLERAGHA
jgi:hypothetical protein